MFKINSFFTYFVGILHVIIMSKLKCISFQSSWLSDEEFKSWLARDPSSQHKARCIFCHGPTATNTINIQSMGRTALLSHAKGEKHKEFLRTASKGSQSTLNFVKAPVPSTSTSASNPNHSSSISSTCATDVARAEAIWLFQTIEDNRPFICNEKLGECFSSMFPDSQIARNISLGKTKTMYNITYGIAPYLSSLIEDKIKGHEYVLLFDETMNKELQKKQMDW